IPTTVVPNFIVPGGPPQELQMGITHSATAKFTANWLVADRTYFLGLRASSRDVELARRMRANTELDTRLECISTYYMAFVADQTMMAFESNIVSIEKALNDPRALYENGFSEKIDVSRLELQLGNLKIRRNQFQNQRDFSYRILKFQMGMDVNAPLQLS